MRTSTRFVLSAVLLLSAATASAQSLDSLKAELRKLGDSGEFSGVVLIRKGGKTVLHEAYGLASIEYKVSNTTDTRFNLASVGKMFTAASIAQLVEAGKLKWTDTLSRVLPDYPNKAQAGRITIHQLLTHTSGMGLYWEKLFKGNWTAVRTAQELVPFFVDDTLLAEPGKAWNYSNTGYAVLALVVEKVSGEDYFAYLQKHIFDPLGMKGTDYAALDVDVGGLKATGYFRDGPNAELKNNLFTHTVKGGGAGGGWATSSDLATFAEAYMSARLFSKAILAEVTTPHVTLPPPPGGGGSGAAPRYGYGTFVNTRDGKTVWGHTGGFPGIMTVLNIYPQSGDVLVVQSNTPNQAARKVWQAAEKLM